MAEIEMLKRENELLRELVKAKDQLIQELRLKVSTPLIQRGSWISDAKPWNPGEFKFNPGPQSNHPNYGGVTLCQGSTVNLNMG